MAATWPMTLSASSRAGRWSPALSGLGRLGGADQGICPGGLLAETCRGNVFTVGVLSLWKKAVQGIRSKGDCGKDVATATPNEGFTASLRADSLDLCPLTSCCRVTTRQVAGRISSTHSLIFSNALAGIRPGTPFSP